MWDEEEMLKAEPKSPNSGSSNTRKGKGEELQPTVSILNSTWAQCALLFIAYGQTLKSYTMWAP